MISRVRIALVLAAAFLTTTGVIAYQAELGSYDLSWHTIDGGGGTSSGGNLVLTGTIGQPDASTVVMTGGPFELHGGFWAGGTTPIPTCPPDIAPSGGDGLVNVQDLLGIINQWGACPGAPALCPADIAPSGGDGQVNVLDLLAIISAWGACP